MADLPGYTALPANAQLDPASPAGYAPLPSNAKVESFQPYTGSVLPFSMDAQGNTHFDPHAGILGSVIDAFTAPGDVASGKLDPYSAEAERRALNFATLASPVNPAVRAGDFAIPGAARNLRQTTPPAPTAAALKAATDTGYDAVRATGATYPGEAVSAAARDTVNGLNADGFIATNAPKTHAILQGLSNPEPGAFATIVGLDSARRALGKVTGDATDMAAAKRAIGAIDDFIQARGEASPMAGASAAPGSGTAIVPGAGGPTEATAGTAESEAARLIQDARGNAAALFRSNRITDAEDAAELRAAAANSGHNVGNATRQRLASLLLNDKATRGYTPGELAAIEQVVRGTASSNTLRHVGNMLGGGGGIGHSLVSGLGGAAGWLLGGPEGAATGAIAAPIVGSAARHAYNSAVQRAVDNVAQSVRMRSPLYNQMLAGAPQVPGSVFGGLLGP